MFEPHKAAYRHPKYKTAYRVKNWAEHDEIFGSEVILLFWFSQDVVVYDHTQGRH